MSISENQAKYQNLLLKKALEKAEANPTALLFDPQGRVLIDIPASETSKDDTREELTGLGFSPTHTTTVSLDVNCSSVLKEQFKQI